MFKEMHIMNVYTPASNPEAREKYFTRLRDWQIAQIPFSIIAGDYNCVEASSLDRFGQIRPERTERETLSRIVQDGPLADARVLQGSALSELGLSLLNMAMRGCQ
ncbi:hypothetical protein PHMEG_00010477 [Phytophthora megakarya]|uniref:Reverse transcriptase n=1 Tax=Phytophthora megakarya TaxID=4795 RepID=A0A225WDL2_9STRA|nr:hypothetical protein PHMEG_00010477 [Phytophthora megakarya]